MLEGERMVSHTRKLPIGAEFIAHQGVSFRIWAPALEELEVVIADPVDNHLTPYSMKKEEKG